MSRESDYKAQFSELMEAFAGPIRRLCAAYALSAADREDLFQDIFLAVWRALPGFRGDSSARTWLYRIAHNVALTWQARDRRRQSRERHLDDDIEAAGHMDLRRIALKRAIAAMKPADRILTLLWLEGLSAAEIEDVTGVKSATVAVRLSRIRKQLNPNNRGINIAAGLALALLCPALLWCAAYGITPLVRGGYALMAAGTAILVSTGWMYSAWSRQALPGPADARSQLQKSAFLLSRQAALMRTAPLCCAPVFLGTALIGTWIYQQRSAPEVYLLWVFVAAGWVIVSVRAMSEGRQLDERRVRMEQLLRDLT